MSKRYNTYKLLGQDRIKGPGLDIWFRNLDCAKCAANYLDLAYAAGRKAGLNARMIRADELPSACESRGTEALGLKSFRKKIRTDIKETGIRGW